MSKQLTLNEDELITVELSLTVAINRIKAVVPPDNWIYTSLKKLEELQVKVARELYK